LLEVVAHVLLVEVVLLPARLMTVRRPIARAVRRQHLIDQDQLVGAAALGIQGVAELELRVGKNDPAVQGILGPGGVDGQGRVPQPLDDLPPAHRTGLLEVQRLVVAARGLGRGREDRLGQPVSIAEAFGQRHAAHGSALLVLAPARPGQVPAYHELDGDDLSGPADHDPPRDLRPLGGVEPRHVGGVTGDDVVADDPQPADHLEPLDADLRKQPALAGDGRGQDHVKGADAIGGHDQQPRWSVRFGREAVDVADLALPSAWKRQVGSHHWLVCLPGHGIG
jgi:hypothetical protein